MGKLPNCALGGEGTVRYAGYRGFKGKGLRNKRSAHRARLKKAEEMKKLQRERAKEAQYEYDNPYEGFSYREDTGSRQ